MKNIWKQILLFAAVSGGMLLTTGCLEDKMPALDGYPQTPVGIVISDTKTPTVVLKGTYKDVTGELLVEGIPSRTYVFSLPQASPNDVTIYLEPIIVNIPADKVSIDVTEIHIPAGQVEAELTATVTLAEDDLSFMDGVMEAKTYELGVRIVDVKGFNTPLSQMESKVIIEKEEYAANCSLSGVDGNVVALKRAYWEGAILNADPMICEFKAYLDKPLQSDVKVKMEATGIAEQFMKDMSITPVELTIPAGSLESTESATWTLTDDFLLTTDKAEKHQVLVKPVAVSGNQSKVNVDAKKDVLTIDILKVLEAFVLRDGLNANWVELDRTGWTATGNGDYGKPGNLLDNSPSNDYYSDEETMWVAVDMKTDQSLVGFSMQYYATAYATKKASIEISSDGQTWTSLGTLDKLPITGTHHFDLLSHPNTRYVKYISLEKYGFYHDFGVIRVYTKN